MTGRKEIVEFLKNKWAHEDGYRLRKELFAFTDNVIAVQVRHPPVVDNVSTRPLTRLLPQFWYEWYKVQPDGTKQWYRTYGLEVRNLLFPPFLFLRASPVMKLTLLFFLFLLT